MAIDAYSLIVRQLIFIHFSRSAVVDSTRSSRLSDPPETLKKLPPKTLPGLGVSPRLMSSISFILRVPVTSLLLCLMSPISFILSVPFPSLLLRLVSLISPFLTVSSLLLLCC